MNDAEKKASLQVGDEVDGLSEGGCRDVGALKVAYLKKWNVLALSSLPPLVHFPLPHLIEGQHAAPARGESFRVEVAGLQVGCVVPVPGLLPGGAGGGGRKHLVEDL